ncbi:growth factor receptor-bound protein 14-like [Styela clava]
MNCLNTKAVVRSPLATAPGNRAADDDVDLESLISMRYDDEESDRQSEIFNNSGTSDESTTSLDNGMSNHCNGHGKVTNGKSFFKSLPMAILSRKKLFGSHSDLSNQRPSSPVIPVQLSSSIPQSDHNSSFKHRKSPLVERSAHNKSNGVHNQKIWSVWVSDSNMFQDVELPYDATCSLLLHMLLLKLQRQTDLTTWSIVLQDSEFLIERIIEDHEVLVDIKDTWSSESINKLCLNISPTKFEILQNPESCLPPGMLTMSSQPTLIMESTEAKRYKMQYILTKTAPEFCGWLHVRDCGARFWKKTFCVLRNSGLYCSSKGESKEPRHLQCFADVLSSNVWVSAPNKKFDSTSYCFCIKSKGSPDMKWLSADSQLEQRAWINAIRLIMNGNRFHECYVNARRRGATVFSRLRSSAPLSSSENNLVAMDFSGNQGRVISDPSELAMMELEQQTSWRRKIIRSHAHVGSCHADMNGSSAPTQQMAWIARSIHQTQPWFYGKISREDAAEVLHRQGLIEGSYLVRDSHRIPGGFVITLCHNQKIKHIAVSQIEVDGQWCFSLDNGETRFADLIQLIDFHRLNRGTLPCQLQHEAISSYS